MIHYARTEEPGGGINGANMEIFSGFLASQSLHQGWQKTHSKQYNQKHSQIVRSTYIVLWPFSSQISKRYKELIVGLSPRANPLGFVHCKIFANLWLEHIGGTWLCQPSVA
jgi:hypothetical protein